MRNVVNDVNIHFYFFHNISILYLCNLNLILFTSYIKEQNCDFASFL